MTMGSFLGRPDGGRFQSAEIDPSQENVEEVLAGTKVPGPEPICPYVDKPCLKTGCLAYRLSEETEWQETKLEPRYDEETKETREVEVTTGRVLKGHLASCSLGVFPRGMAGVVPVEGKAVEAGLQVSESSNARELASRLLIDRG